jgi:hypothetical protein
VSGDQFVGRFTGFKMEKHDEKSERLYNLPQGCCCFAHQLLPRRQRHASSSRGLNEEPMQL